MTPTPTDRLRKHHQDRPDFTAALRRAVWLYDFTGRPFAAKDIQEEVQRARQGMGLAPYRGGAVSDYLQRRTRGTELQRQDRQPVHYEFVDRKRIPVEAVRQNWRFLCAPDHAQIRLTADQGHLQPGSHTPCQFHFASRGSHLPSLTVLVGPIAEVRRLVEEKYQHRAGLYLLHRNGQNYLGQTKEFHVRGRSHSTTGAEQAFFAFPDEKVPVSSDVLNVAESLVIVSLSELLELENTKLGGDTTPQPLNLREGSGFALTFVAALAKWAHLHEVDRRTFLVWRSDVRGLEEAYLTLTPYIAPPPAPAASAPTPATAGPASVTYLWPETTWDGGDIQDDIPELANLCRAVEIGGEGGSLLLLGPHGGEGEFFYVSRIISGWIEDDIPVYSGANLIPAGRTLIGALDFMQSYWRRMTGVHVAPHFKVEIQAELQRHPDAKPYEDWRLSSGRPSELVCTAIWPDCDYWPDGVIRDACRVEGNLDEVRALLGRVPHEHQVQLQTRASEPFVMIVSRDGTQRYALPEYPFDQEDGAWLSQVFRPVRPVQLTSLDDLLTLPSPEVLAENSQAAEHSWIIDANPGILFFEPAMRHYEALRVTAGSDVENLPLWEMAQLTRPMQVFRFQPEEAGLPVYTVMHVVGIGMEHELVTLIGDEHERDSVQISIALRNMYFVGQRDALNEGKLTDMMAFALSEVDRVNRR